MTSDSSLGHAVAACWDCLRTSQRYSKPITSRTAQHIASLLALHRVSGLHRDPAFLLCLASGLLFWIVLFVAFSPQPLPWERLWSLQFLSPMIWQPIIEELFFRGLIQGQLRRLEWGRRSFIDISIANLLTSAMFVFAHLVSHSLAWSLLVFIPSLLFGLLRDRFESVYPSIVLHIFYNAGYFLLTGGLIFRH